MRKLLPFFTVTTLFGILTAPAVLMLAGITLGHPLTENRPLAEFPDQCEEITKCVDDARNWLNDNSPIRNLLIRTHTQIQYSVFGVSDKVHIGKDGWLFYRSTMDVEKTNLERHSEHSVEKFQADLLKLKLMLGAESIELIVLPLPLKDTIYPEMIPSTVPSLPAPSQYKKLVNWLKTSEITTIDAAKTLTELKLERSTFHRTDFHWNDPAAFRLATDLVNMLADDDQALRWKHLLEIEKKQYSGGQASFLPLLRTPSEQSIFLVDTWTATSTSNYKYGDSAGFWEYLFERNPETGGLGSLVVFGDSFFDGFHRSGFDLHFSEVRRARINTTSLADVLGNRPCNTKYFLFETIESSLFGWIAAGLSLPDELPPCVP